MELKRLTCQFAGSKNAAQVLQQIATVWKLSVGLTEEISGFEKELVSLICFANLLASYL